MPQVFLTKNDAGKTIRLTAGPNWEVFGTTDIDSLSIDKAANVYIFGDSGDDVVRLSGKATDYKVSGNGNTAIFTNIDGSAVSMGTDLSGDSIIFGDGTTAKLKIDSGAIKLNAQVINSTPSAITGTGSTTTTPTTTTQTTVVGDYGVTMSTAGKAIVGGSVTSSIEKIGDQDWFAVSLNAGTAYTIRQQGQGHGVGTLWNPKITGIYSSTAALIADSASDDSRIDGGTNGRDSLVTFTPKTSDTYYIAAAVSASASGIGTYTLSVTPSVSTSTSPTTVPTLSLAAPLTPPAAEGNSGATPYTFTATRTGNLSAASSAIWEVKGSGANPANAADFVGGVLPSGTVTFAAGQATATVTVNVQGNTLLEPTENFSVTLSKPAGAITGFTSATATINQSVSGGLGTTEKVYTLPGDGGEFSLNYNMHAIPDRASIYVNGALAVSTNTLVSDTGILTIPSTTALKAGDQVKVVITNTNIGTSWDYNVTYLEGVPTSNHIAVGAIVDDDSPLPALSLAAANFPASEGNSGTTAYNFTVTRAGNLNGASTVAWEVSGSGVNPAIASDFVGGALPTGTVSFAAGEATKTLTVNVKGDTRVELDEGFTVTLANPVGAILDVSVPGTAFKSTASGGYGVTEKTYVIVGNGSNFALNYEMYSIPDQADIYVNGTLAASTGRPVSDKGTLTITTALFAGDKVKVVMTGLDPGTVWDYTLDYAGGLSAINYIAAGSIVNDDKDTPTTLTVEPSKISAIEGNSNPTPYTFTAVRSGNLDVISTADWRVTGIGINPANATDFAGGILPSGTVSFAAGEDAKTVTVNVQGDTTVERDESFAIALSNPVGTLLSAPLDVIKQTASGGLNQVTTNYYVLANGDGVLTLSYDMKVIPDKADLYVNEMLAVSTNGLVSGTGTLTTDTLALHAGDQIKIVITGTDSNTIWDYTLDYPRGLSSLNTILTDDFAG